MQCRTGQFESALHDVMVTTAAGYLQKYAVYLASAESGNSCQALHGEVGVQVGVYKANQFTYYTMPAGCFRLPSGVVVREGAKEPIAEDLCADEVNPARQTPFEEVLIRPLQGRFFNKSLEKQGEGGWSKLESFFC